MKRSSTYTSRITATGLLFVFLFLGGLKPYIHFSFLLQQDQIASEKCENKAKPDLQCNGKCYLNKQLNNVDNASSSDKNLPSSQKRFSFPEPDLYVCTSPISFYHLNLKQTISIEINSSTQKGISSVFIPPPEVLA